VAAADSLRTGKLQKGTSMGNVVRIGQTIPVRCSRQSPSLSARMRGLLPTAWRRPRLARAGDFTRERERRLVRATCACLLDDGDLPLRSWSPTSIDALLGHAARHDASSPNSAAKPTGLAHPFIPAGAALLLVGLQALDRGAQDEQGCDFDRAPRARQLALLGKLENGQLGLNRAIGMAFVDRFMELAAQAYLAVAWARPEAPQA
jgi:hypothetical protein